MGKRSDGDYERVERDFYPTPYAAVEPLVPFLPNDVFTFAEPCAGDGRMTGHFVKATRGNAICPFQSDIQPMGPGIVQKNALMLSEADVADCDMIITNPPWDRTKKSGYLLHSIIEVFADLRPTWLIFDADWVQTVQAKPYLDRLVCTVSVGRVKWIEDSKTTGKDNCQWHLFWVDAREITEAPLFFGRGVQPPGGFVTDCYSWNNALKKAA